MAFYWIKTNILIKKVFSKYFWDFPNKEKKVYLTFDDGPTPEITEWVLQQLKNYDAKATFFCIGNNIKKYPAIYSKIIQENHSVGNHSFDHLNGWKTITNEYIENVLRCENQIKQSWPVNINESLYLKTKETKLFRPPYGKIKTAQAKELLEKGYKIIMWDVLSADFDTTISTGKCLENVIKNVTSGSIIVFHDSTKAFPNLEYVLPKALDFLQKNNYKCATIDFQ